MLFIKKVVDYFIWAIFILFFYLALFSTFSTKLNQVIIFTHLSKVSEILFLVSNKKD